MKRPPIELSVPGHIAPADVTALFERVCDGLGRSPADLLICDVASIRRPDAATVDLLARLVLATRRRGGDILVRNASTELLDLLELAGLSGVVPTVPAQDSRRGGRPNIGKKRAVSRKKVIPLIQPSDSSRT